MNRFHIIKKAYLRLIVGAVVFASAVVLFFINARYSVEFTGGIEITVDERIDETKTVEALDQYLTAQGYEDTRVAVQPNEQSTITLKTNVDNDEKVAALSEDIKTQLVTAGIISNVDEILEFGITGPSVGNYMQSAALRALIIGIIFMVIYMLFSFSAIRKYVSPTILAVVTVITMFFDIAIPAGAFGVRMSINPTITVNTVFIIAILTTMGYSINDTIIIFDRIRENMKKHNTERQTNIVHGKVFEDSLWQTMRRSIGTSVSTLLVIIAMYVFGTGVIQQFAFVMGIGVIAGTYSSLFLAAPLAYLLSGKFNKEKNKL